MIEFISRSHSFAKRIAIKSNNKSFTYDQLYNQSDLIARCLLGDRHDLNEECIAYITDPSFEYSATQWGIWKAGGVGVPLCILHPLPAMEYVLKDTGTKIVIAEKKFTTKLKPLIAKLGLNLIVYEQLEMHHQSNLPDISENRKAMILYTSGTTNLPKGVVTTHANIKAQIDTLVKAWAWSMDDHILNVLPLHHVHGIINVMSCALRTGACCEFLAKFEPEKVWNLFCQRDINLFMAVPTIYYQLIKFWENASILDKKKFSSVTSEFRLMVSGSAALPVSTLEKWKNITGQTLLERYGMTEIGMGLSNPYNDERRPGHVGKPLPGVEIRLVDESNEVVGTGDQGEIQIKGPSVFLEYWNKSEATKTAFTVDGWFRTGDIAILNKGYYRILGRNSVDIIKSGGYKISALEIEEILRLHPLIDDCGVVGIPDEEWGEIVGAAITSNEKSLDFSLIKNWLSERLPMYRVPRKYLLMDELPRNTLGKITKKQIVKTFIESN